MYRDCQSSHNNKKGFEQPEKTQVKRQRLQVLVKAAVPWSTLHFMGKIFQLSMQSRAPMCPLLLLKFQQVGQKTPE